MLLQRQSELEDLGGYAGLSSPAVDLMPPIIALLMSRIAAGEAAERDQAKAALQRLKQLVPNLGSAAADRLDEVLATMVVLVVPGEAPPQPPFLQLDTFLKAVARVLGSNQDNLLELSKGALPLRILAALQRHLGEALSPDHQVPRMAGVEAFVALMPGNSLLLHSSIRALVHLLSLQLNRPAVQDAALVLLNDLVTRVYDHGTDPALDALGFALPGLCSQLVECLELRWREGYRDMDAAADNVQVRMLVLLRRLTDEIPELAAPRLAPCQRQLDPFPRMFWFSTIAKYMGGLRGEVTVELLREDLERLVARARSSTQTSRVRAMRQIVEDAKELLAAEDGSVHSGDLETLQQVAWRVVQLSGELNDAELAAMTGALLGLLGPLDPSTVAFYAADTSRAARGRRAELPPDSQQPMAAMAQDEDEDDSAAQDAVIFDALRLLATYLLDPDASVVAATHAALSFFLSTSKGMKEFQRLDPTGAERPLLEPFTRSRGLVNQAEYPDPGPLHGPSLDHDSVWMPVGRSQEEWCSGLCQALLVQCKDPLLRALGPVARLKGEMAALLLPRVFESLALDSPTAEMHRVLSVRLARNVLHPGNSDVGSIRTALACLNHLKRVNLEELASHGVHDRIEGDDDKTHFVRYQPNRHRGGSPAASCPSAFAWPKVYWLDIDYLEVAACALRASACFSALVFIEHW